RLELVTGLPAHLFEQLNSRLALGLEGDELRLDHLRGLDGRDDLADALAHLQVGVAERPAQRRQRVGAELFQRPLGALARLRVAAAELLQDFLDGYRLGGEGSGNEEEQARRQPCEALHGGDTPTAGRRPTE